MSTTTTAATISASPGWWVRRRPASGPAELLPVLAWNVPTTGAAEAICLDGPTAHATGTLSGNLSGTIDAVIFDPTVPAPKAPA